MCQVNFFLFGAQDGTRVHSRRQQRGPESLREVNGKDDLPHVVKQSSHHCLVGIHLNLGREFPGQHSDSDRVFPEFCPGEVLQLRDLPHRIEAGYGHHRVLDNLEPEQCGRIFRGGHLPPEPEQGRIRKLQDLRRDGLVQTENQFQIGRGNASPVFVLSQGLRLRVDSGDRWQLDDLVQGLLDILLENGLVCPLPVGKDPLDPLEQLRRVVGMYENVHHPGLCTMKDCR